MAPDQEAKWVAEDVLIQNVLGKAGWQPTDHGSAFQIAELVHRSGSMTLQVGHEILKSELLITMSAEEGESRVLVEMHDEPDALLETLERWQSTISADNFRDFVEDVLVNYPDTFVVTEDSRKRIHPRSAE